MKKTLITLGIIVVIIIIWLVARSGNKPAQQTVAVTRHTITETVTAVGNIVPKHIITVRSALTGIVTRIYKNNGDKVTKGENLALIGPNVAPDTLAQAISQVDAQKAKVVGDQKLVNNDTNLIKSKLTTSAYSNYINNVSTLAQDQATLLYYIQNLGLLKEGRATIGGVVQKGQVVSPIDGYILHRFVDVGDSIISLSSTQSATNLFVIADMSDMVFRGAVNEVDADKLKVGMPAKVSIGPLGGIKINGNLAELGLQSNQENKRFNTSNQQQSSDSPFSVGYEVKIDHLVLPKAKYIRSGFSATAQFTSHVYKNVLTLPERVVQFTATGSYVWVPQGKGKLAKKVEVTTGASDGTNIQIVSGLKLGDTVLVNAGSSNA